MNIYQHFRPEEKEFIDHARGWVEAVKQNYCPRLTDFLNPREQQILLALVGNDDAALLQFFGGSEAVERKRALIYPDYYVPEKADYQLILFEISYPKKFISLEHRHVLGTLMSLGLKREKFGDILIDGQNVQFIAAAEIEDYLTANLEKMGNVSVSIKKLSLTEIIIIKEHWEEQSHTVSSLRLDVLLAAVTNLSRQKAQTLLAAGKVKVNFKSTEHGSMECREGDTLSVRGFGRAKILSIDGKTKKEKWRISIGRHK
ncbi:MULTISPECIES: YlmH family RNA-binding protein [Bacillaceae]|uniref:RNA-binding protein YlmH n=1 Tax=Peribacillus huizhouensis TaxID=1501239 RepID=A0ABR6CIR6_9BACI|nr:MULTISPECIES: RNA-binding protein [Bacillaceae]MBA9024946.1 RNA-binding protein YlmH [Peribacillus huizhouensis]